MNTELYVNLEDEREPMSLQDREEFEKMMAPVELAVNDSDMEDEIESLTYDDECGRFPWNKPFASQEITSERFSESRILSLDYNDGEPSIIARMAKESAERVQFPGNTAYLHGLGIFSSAVVVNFEIEYRGKSIPAGLYTLCAQPSGSGKSGAHGHFIDPIIEALEERNKYLYLRHRNIDQEIDRVEGLVKKCVSDVDLRVYAMQLDALRKDKYRQPLVGKPMKNVTPEAAEEVAAQQGGVMNVCSDEAEAIDSYLGVAYKDSRKSRSNNGMFISCYDGGYIHTARVGRVGYEGKVRGAFAVIAQAAVIDTIVEEGSLGRGVNERVLLIKERTLIGYRTHTLEYDDFDPDLAAEYRRICIRVLEGEYPRRLTMSLESMRLIIDVKNHIEVLERPGAKYGGDQIRGFASKMEQHITKMAAVLHVADQFSDKNHSKPSMVIPENITHKAILVCMDLLESYRCLVESFTSVSGEKHIIEIMGALKHYVSKKGLKHITIGKLRLYFAKTEWFRSLENKTEFLANILERCETMNLCHIKEVGSNKGNWVVLLNPQLAQFTIDKDAL